MISSWKLKSDQLSRVQSSATSSCPNSSLLENTLIYLLTGEQWTAEYLVKKSATSSCNDLNLLQNIVNSCWQLKVNRWEPSAVVCYFKLYRQQLITNTMFTRWKLILNRWVLYPVLRWATSRCININMLRIHWTAEYLVQSSATSSWTNSPLYNYCQQKVQTWTGAFWVRISATTSCTNSRLLKKSIIVCYFQLNKH